MEHSESIKNIAAALAKAQAVMHGATKDGKNPAFKSSYATLQSVIEAARGPLSENGIAFLQSPGAIDDNTISITTTLLHESGEWLSERLAIPFEKRTPQSVGSAISYGRRYSLMSFLGMPAVDDDGEAAMPERRPAPRQLEPMPPQLKEDAATPPPKTNADLDAVAIERDLLAGIRGVTSAKALQAFTLNADNVRSYEALPQDAQGRISTAIEQRRRSLGSAVASAHRAA